MSLRFFQTIRAARTLKILSKRCAVATILAASLIPSATAQKAGSTTVKRSGNSIQAASSPRLLTGAASTATGANALMNRRAPVQAPASKAPRVEVQADGSQVLHLPDFQITLPADWKNQPTQSSMRVAQIGLPGSAGPGELVLFYFGPDAGGVEANIQRWYGQMEDPDGQSIADLAKRREIQVAEFSVTMIDVTGTIKASSMPGMGSSTARPNQRLLAAIVMTKSGPWFLKVTGPEVSVSEQAEAFDAAVQSINLPGPAASAPRANTEAVGMPPAGSTAGVAPGAAMPGEAPALDMAGSASEEASGLAGSAGMAPAADSSSVPAGFPPSFGTATAAGPVPDATGRVQLDGLSFVIPKNWLNEPPSSMMRQAQMLLPAAEGATLETRMVVFYLGPNAGSIEANIERWYGQLSDPQGRSIESLAKRESFEVDGMKVTIVDVIGTLEASSTPGMGSPITQPESRLLAAIVEAPSGPWFFKGVGPVSTMADAGQTFKGMLKTIQAVRP